MRSRALAVASLVLALAVVAVPAAAAHRPSGRTGHSRPNCRSILPFGAIATGTGKNLTFMESGPDRFPLGYGREIARGQSCVYADPARAEYTVDPHAGFLKTAFEATPQEGNILRTREKKEPTFRAMKTVDGATLFLRRTRRAGGATEPLGNRRNRSSSATRGSTTPSRSASRTSRLRPRPASSRASPKGSTGNG